MTKERTRALEARLIDLAEKICRLSERLPDTHLGNHVAGQLLRCGTSAGPNYGEAQSSESRKDFIHKMQVCLKELRETHVWLELVTRLQLDDHSDLRKVRTELNELIAIFVASITTARRNAQRAGTRV